MRGPLAPGAWREKEGTAPPAGTGEAFALELVGMIYRSSSLGAAEDLGRNAWWNWPRDRIIRATTSNPSCLFAFRVGLGAPVAFPQFEISFSELILTVVGFTRTFGRAFRFSQFWLFAAMGRGIKK